MRSKIICLSAFILFATVPIVCSDTTGDSKANSDEFMVVGGLNAEQGSDFTSRLQRSGEFYAHIDLGRKFYRNGQLDLAQKEFEVVIRESKTVITEGEALLGLAQVYDKKGQYTQELKTLEKFCGGGECKGSTRIGKEINARIAVLQQSEEFMVIGGMNGKQSADFSNRLQKSEQWIGPVMEHINKAKKLLQDNDFKNAEAEYKAAIQIANKSVLRGIGRRGLADVYDRSRQYELAIKTLELLKEEDIVDPDGKAKIDQRIQSVRRKI